MLITIVIMCKNTDIMNNACNYIYNGYNHNNNSKILW